MPHNYFKNANMKNTLTGNGKLGNVLKKVMEGDYQGALDKINDDLLPKVDGCSDHWVDSDDWIVNCPAQSAVYGSLNEIAELVIDLSCNFSRGVPVKSRSNICDLFDCKGFS